VSTNAKANKARFKAGLKLCVRCHKDKSHDLFPVQSSRVCSECANDTSGRWCSGCKRIRDDGDFATATRKTCLHCAEIHNAYRARREAGKLRGYRSAGARSVYGEQSSEQVIARVLEDKRTGKLDGGRWLASKAKPGTIETGLPVSVDTLQMWHWSRGRQVSDVVADAWVAR